MKKVFSNFLLFFTQIINTSCYLNITHEKIESKEMNKVFQIFDNCKHITLIHTGQALDFFSSFHRENYMKGVTYEVYNITIDDDDNYECVNMNRFVSINDYFNYDNGGNKRVKSLTQAKVDVFYDFVKKG